MKYRKGFVSNSSSSSFVCDICGEEVTGMDMSLREAEMCECENGHVFCREHFNYENEEELELAMEDDDFEYNVPEKFCPICSFKELMESTIICYIELNYDITQQQVYAYMKSVNSRLRKIRNRYWFELLEKTKSISKYAVEQEIKAKFKSLNEFEQYVLNSPEVE